MIRLTRKNSKLPWPQLNFHSFGLRCHVLPCYWRLSFKEKIWVFMPKKNFKFCKGSSWVIGIIKGTFLIILLWNIDSREFTEKKAKSVRKSQNYDSTFNWFWKKTYFALKMFRKIPVQSQITKNVEVTLKIDFHYSDKVFNMCMNKH